MSLNVSLGTAVSSLLALEQQMQVASNNISNATTDGYTEKTAVAVTKVSGGTGTGVSIAGIESTVDKYLLRQVIDANSDAASASTTYAYYDSLQEALGVVETTTASTSGSDFASDIATLASDLNALSDSPTDSSTQSQVAADLTQLAADLRSTSQSVQNFRQQASDEIASTVDDINSQLQTIADLNKSISLAKARGETTADLEDQRNTALKSLSADVGVSYYVDGNDQMQVYTQSGALLVNRSTAMTLSYDSPSISTGTTYPSGGIGGITVGGKDITGSMATGKLSALIDQRDTVLTGVQAELDNLASSLSTSLNAVAGAAGYADLFSDGSSAATIQVNSTDAVTAGVSGVASSLADAMSASNSFTAAGNLSASTSSFNSYATKIISDISARYTSASAASDTATSVLTQLSDSFSNQSGVNTDSETAKLTELQNLYASSAQIITTAKNMFSALLSAVQS